MSKGLFYRFMCWYDQRWREWHKVEKIDELISLSLGEHKGERRLMSDGTWIEPGDCLAILHFNRECFIPPGNTPRDYVRSALHFRKLILASFGQLSQRIQTDPMLRDVKALYGVSWLPPHGEKVGFEIERIPDSLLNNVRKFYFRVLLKTFFPVLAARENNRLQPHAYWLTRQNLIRHFSRDNSSDESASSKVQSRAPQDAGAIVNPA